VASALEQPAALTDKSLAQAILLLLTPNLTPALALTLASTRNSPSHADTWQVMESWRLVLGNGGYDSIRLEDLRIFVRDDMVRAPIHEPRAADCHLLHPCAVSAAHRPFDMLLSSP
jgi:hypothetical protein